MKSFIYEFRYTAVLVLNYAGCKQSAYLTFDPCKLCSNVDRKVHIAWTKYQTTNTMRKKMLRRKVINYSFLAMLFFFYCTCSFTRKHNRTVSFQFFVSTTLNNHSEQCSSLYIWKWDYTMCSFFQSPHLGGQNCHFQSSKVLKSVWASTPHLQFTRPAPYQHDVTGSSYIL